MIALQQILNVRHHGFKIQNKELTKQWLKNSGAEHLSHLNRAELKRYFICSKHFKASSYSGCNKTKRYFLLPDAVPVPHEGIQDPVEGHEGPSKTLAATSKLFFNANEAPIKEK